MRLKIYTFLLFFVLPAVSIFSQNGLSLQLDALLKDKLFEDSDVSLTVFDLTADSMLYSHRAKKLCRPASVTKIVTAVTALARLGCDYEISTRLFMKENVSGGNNIYVRGEIDPLFCEEELDSMLSVLPDGLVVDTLFADCTFMDSVYWGPGWSWDDTPWEYQPYISPLMLNGGCVRVTATPAAKGVAPLVECVPQSGYYDIVNEAVSGVDSGEKFTIMRDWLDNSNVIRLRGNCNAVKSEKMNLYPSQGFFMRVMQERLACKNIPVANTVYARVPHDALLLVEINRPIADVVSEALMESNNLCAEALSYHLGSLYGRFPVRQNDGPEIIKSFVEYAVGVSDRFNIADGSGLSLYTYLSADILTSMLCYAFNDSAIRDVIMHGLPQAGISGTMKHRCKGTNAYRKIYAKTGTVKGVCTLAGYAVAGNGHNLAFVIMNQNTMSAREARCWQDRVCELICR